MSTHGPDFVPMVGLERDIVDLMQYWLDPVMVDADSIAAIDGMEQCATAIVALLRDQGLEV